MNLLGNVFISFFHFFLHSRVRFLFTLKVRLMRGRLKSGIRISVIFDASVSGGRINDDVVRTGSDVVTRFLPLHRRHRRRRSVAAVRSSAGFLESDSSQRVRRRIVLVVVNVVVLVDVAISVSGQRSKFFAGRGHRRGLLLDHGAVAVTVVPRGHVASG